MSLWRHFRSENRKHIKSKAWKEFMFWFDGIVDDYVRDPWRYITNTFWERLGRSIAYAKFAWHNYDFDAGYAHELLLFKLKRIHHCFIHYGYHSEECDNYKLKMKSLELTIKLLERYCTPFNEYYDKSINRHDAKWGKLETWNTPHDTDKDGYVRTYLWNSKRANVNTPEEEVQEHKEFVAAMTADDNRKERDIKLAYAIIAKYHNYWWD